MGDTIKKQGGPLGAVNSPDTWETIDKLRETLGDSDTLTLKRMRCARMHEVSCILQFVLGVMLVILSLADYRVLDLIINLFHGIAICAFSLLGWSGSYLVRRKSLFAFFILMGWITSWTSDMLVIDYQTWVNADVSCKTLLLSNPSVDSAGGIKASSCSGFYVAIQAKVAVEVMIIMNGIIGSFLALRGSELIQDVDEDRNMREQMQEVMLPLSDASRNKVSARPPLRKGTPGGASSQANVSGVLPGTVPPS